MTEAVKAISAETEDSTEDNEKGKQETAVGGTAIQETASTGKRLVLPPKKMESESNAWKSAKSEVALETEAQTLAKGETVLKTERPGQAETEKVLGTETQEMAKSKRRKRMTKEEVASELNVLKEEKAGTSHETAEAGTAQVTEPLGNAEAEVILAAEAQKLAEEADGAGMLEIETQKAAEPERILEPETRELAEETDGPRPWRQGRRISQQSGRSLSFRRSIRMKS